jgi:hypothetical protein
MTTGRKRANRSVGSKLNQTAQKVEEIASSTSSGVAEDAIGPTQLKENSVGPDALQPDSVDSYALGPAAVGTENLGVVNRITSEDTLFLFGPGYGEPTAAPRTLALTVDNQILALAAGTASPNLVEGRISRFWTDGPAYVYISGNNTEVGPFKWVDSYTPVPNENVFLVRVTPELGDYVIIGKRLTSYMLPFAKQVPIDEPSGLTALSGYESPAYSMSVGGITTVKGVWSATANIAAGTVIATLHSRFAPDTYMNFPVLMGGSPNTIQIRPDGTIRVLVAVPSGNYLSMSGIAFPAKGVATWTPIVPNASYVASDPNSIGLGARYDDAGDSLFGVASWWTDSYNTTWFRGQIRSNTTTVTGGAMILAPDTFRYRNNKLAFVVAAGPVGTTFGALLGSDTSGTLFVQGTGVSTAANLTFDLANIAIPKQGLVFMSQTYQNGWVDFSAEPTAGALNAWAPGGYYRRQDNLVFFLGLVRSGTIGQGLGTFVTGSRPSGRSVGPVYSNGGVGRLDLLSGGGVIPFSGSNASFSLAGRVFQSEQ